LRSGNYSGAIQKLELLEARYPFSDPARQGQLDLLYAYYKNRETESAVDQADQFIRENPTHPRVDYAYYIRGLVYFQAGATWFERVARADNRQAAAAGRPQGVPVVPDLVQSYPKSPYAADARQRMVYLRNRLADYELSVARYYMKRGAYVGALNRARNLSKVTTGPRPVPQALTLAANAYRQLGMEDLAKVAESVREQNSAPDFVSVAAAGAGLAGPGTRRGGFAPAPGAVDRTGRWKPASGSARRAPRTSISRAARLPRSTVGRPSSWASPTPTPTACDSARRSPTTRRTTTRGSWGTSRASRSRPAAPSTR